MTKTKTKYLDVLNEKGEKIILLKVITSQEITGVNGKHTLNYLPKYFTENGDKVDESEGVFIVEKTGEILRLAN